MKLLKSGKFWNIVVIIIIASIVMWLSLKDDTAEKLAALASANIWWVLVAVGVILFWWISEAWILQLIAKSEGHKYRFVDALPAAIIGQFYSAATPSASGGQFFQVYFMDRQGFKITTSVLILTVNFIIYVGSLLVMSVIAAIASFSYFDSFMPALPLWLAIGFAANAVVYLLILNAASSKKFHRTLIAFVARILKLFRRDQQKIYHTTMKLEKNITEFRASLNTIKQNKKAYFEFFLVNCLRLVGFHTLPFFVMLALGVPIVNVPLTLMYCMCGSILIGLITSFIPIPGASGGAEAFFGLFFMNLFPVDLLGPGLILWRSIQLYFPLIVGGIITVWYTAYIKKKPLITEEE
ncbi:lysylphosphatidylglycerol synthase transmembrane domain-containing protein [Culicoidibacter larvae]|nr:lysylphosphatidylglycerol synthase transmembrane domain-containing protein [Culicoidibacter larvae]